MKRNILTLILAGAALLFSCTPEGENGLPSGFTFQERSIVSLKFEHQIGDAIITTIDDVTGTAEVKLAINYIDNLASVDLSSLVISYGATATCKMGDKMDLTVADPTITVTSQSGVSRTYSIIVTPFAEDFEGKYAITGSHLVGGLGGDDGWGWGTMGEDAPENRPWCWDTNGYGPTANYDNYLEIVCTGINDDGSTVGTCVNYGGADGKHWNCIVYKTDAGIVADVHKYYRVIPIGNSTWRRDYSDNTITFTSEDGKQTTCSIFEGTVVISATHNKSFDIPDQALGFPIAGDYTWDNDFLYTDYQKFGVAARYMFLMVSKVAEIPAASKVIGDEGEINIPEPGGDDPGTDPGTGSGDEPADLSAFAGDYKVKSLKILGGGRSGFDEIKDKPWDWTGYTDNYHATNANKEYDNTLAITISGNGGTLNYAPGADGEYWDYTYKNNMNGTNNDYGDITVDMSFNFGQLPHGESTFTIDATTMVVTIKDSDNKTVYGQVYGSGKHTDPATSVSLDVPTGCIALAFQLTPYSGTEYVYEDRFSASDLNMIVFHPNYYVMIFEKQ
ncbi:MAG: hypothetical protein J5740_01300 [Bacteroidales bacterium]|nr:hypothetical protein [Bacteroidales bacterium]